MPVFVHWLLRLGPMNPIAVRLVQNGSRRSRHNYIRTTYLGVLIVVLLWTLLLGASGEGLDYRHLARAGARAFTWIAYLQVVLICVLAPVFMGGAIAQEASPRTWEVLLTTPLTAGEIVLGSLLGRLFFVLALLFASLPLFALTQYFGGVPGRSVFASYLVAGSAALLVGALAIALSVSRLVGKRAFFAFYVSVVGYLAATVAIDRALVAAGKGALNGSGVTYMTALNPFLALHALLNPSAYPRAPEGTYTGLEAWMLESPATTWCLGAIFMSLLFIGVSTLTVRQGGWQTLAEDESGTPLHRRLFGGGGRPGESHRAPRHVWANPIAWREAASRNSSRAKIVARWTFLGAGALFGMAIIYLFHDGTFSPTTFRYALSATIWGELIIIALVGINTSATAISREREDGTLDLLLTTPITASAYLAGKLRGLVTYLLPLLAVPLGTLAAACLYVAMDGLGNEKVGVPGPGGTVVPLVLPEAALTAPLVVVPFMAFCVMVGLHWSLRSRGTISSVVGAVGVVGVVAGVAGLCGWNASPSLTGLGPVLGAISPASMVYAVTNPEEALSSSMTGVGAAGARAALVIGSLLATIVHGALCYSIHANMVRTFDMTVRQLAGER
jgi:ABC-type transport system involved in multi-copper enzyme maturation permease subunit